MISKKKIRTFFKGLAPNAKLDWSDWTPDMLDHSIFATVKGDVPYQFVVEVQFKEEYICVFGYMKCRNTNNIIKQFGTTGKTDILFVKWQDFNNNTELAGKNINVEMSKKLFDFTDDIRYAAEVFAYQL